MLAEGRCGAPGETTVVSVRPPGTPETPTPDKPELPELPPELALTGGTDWGAWAGGIAAVLLLAAGATLWFGRKLALHRERMAVSYTHLDVYKRQMISCSRKKNPSQVAHHDTPCPDRRSSSGRPSLRYADPIVRTTARARYVTPPPVSIVFTSPLRSRRVASS